MGSWGKKKPRPPTTPTTPTTQAPDLPTVSDRAYGLSTEFKADDAIRMPSINSSLEAAARLRRELFARSGRESTRLVGREAYVNRFFGDVG